MTVTRASEPSSILRALRSPDQINDCQTTFNTFDT